MGEYTALSVKDFKGKSILVSDKDGNEFELERYSPDCWYKVYGDSMEAVYGDEDVFERVYQTYINKECHNA